MFKTPPDYQQSLFVHSYNYTGGVINIFLINSELFK